MSIATAALPGHLVTHQADLCTFEVLLARFGLQRPALRRIAEIVHDIDLKEQRYQRAETPTIAALVEGVRQSTADDHLTFATPAATADRRVQDLYPSLDSGNPAGSTSAGENPSCSSRLS